MIDLIAAMDSLCDKRRIFHSEADFQFALAWELKLMHQEARIRLEYPWGSDGEKTAYIDILVTIDGKTIPIELKYFKAKFRAEDDEEMFCLPARSARDHANYDCVKDLRRVERFVRQVQNSPAGYALWLTNDLALTKRVEDENVGDYAFKVYEGAVKHDLMEWGPTAGPKTRASREAALKLNGKYTIHWRDYSDFDEPGGLFRYALVEV